MTYHRHGVEAARKRAGARRKAVEAAGMTVALLDRHAEKRGQS